MYYVIIRINYKQLSGDGAQILMSIIYFFFFLSMYNYRMQQTELAVKQQGKFS